MFAVYEKLSTTVSHSLQTPRSAKFNFEKYWVLEIEHEENYYVCNNNDLLCFGFINLRFFTWS